MNCSACVQTSLFKKNAVRIAQMRSQFLDDMLRVPCSLCVDIGVSSLAETLQVQHQPKIKN